jgi:L-threonylcarbamoyladenylate synthase
MLTEVLGSPPADPDEHSPQVSGSLPSHYAPRAKVRIFAADDRAALHAALDVETAAGRKIVVIAADASSGKHATWLAAPIDPKAFAQAIYALLRECDDLEADAIFVIPPEEFGIGEAIWDRLRKAAAPR